MDKAMSTTRDEGDDANWLQRSGMSEISSGLRDKVKREFGEKLKREEEIVCREREERGKQKVKKLRINHGDRPSRSCQCQHGSGGLAEFCLFFQTFL